MKQKPILGILLGDAAGIGPEIVAKTVASGFLREACRPVIIGDIRVLRQALRTVGKDAALHTVGSVAEIDWETGAVPVLDQKDLDPDTVAVGHPTAETGRAVLAMLRLAGELCVSGGIGGFAFAPLQKAAMIEAGCVHESEHHLLAELFGVTEPSGEINVLGDLMTTRATSHIPIAKVSEQLTVQKVLNATKLLHDTLRRSGVASPRLGMAALNPHCGEGGRCGREEIDVIAPAMELARVEGIDARGPYSADVLFIKAFAGEFDGAVTMYHDQGQIALKLKGFEQGVTVAGGLPYPVATCAHGTACDIAGKGIAATSSFENAVRLAAKMAANI